MQFIFSKTNVHAFFMYTSFPSFYFFVSGCDFVLSFSLSLSLSLSLIDCAMAPKAHKSISARNPLGFGSSSPDPIPPLHIWFHDGRAQKDFLENFQKHGVHLERHIVL